jgi:hypothetical protein
MKITTTTPIQQTTGFCDIIDITAKIQQQIDGKGLSMDLRRFFVSAPGLPLAPGRPFGS